MKNKILLVIVFFFLIVSNNQAQQIDIDVRVSPPYQLNLDGLTNQLLATVRNTNLEASANNINFRLELYGPKGLRISSNRVFDEDIDLEPGEVRQFIGNDWDALYESSNLTITPIQEKQDIINRQSLRAKKIQRCSRFCLRGPNMHPLRLCRHDSRGHQQTFSKLAGCARYL